MIRRQPAPGWLLLALAAALHVALFDTAAPFVLVSSPPGSAAWRRQPLTFSSHSKSLPRACFRHASMALRRRRHNHDDEELQSRSEIPQLPATGSSSQKRSDSDPSRTSDTVSGTFVGSKKFQLQYTCNICETRNHHLVSRVAYRQGVVICTCKGCGSQHLIADHLGFTDYKGGFQGEINTIEDWFSAKNDTETSVHRVSPDVFDLEKILARDTKSGSIVGEDGNLVLE
jgi:DNL zinc finger